ncbi:MAG TPA: hypothetical protein VKE95_10025 [Burkholderiales bacterium]|nr:hypothetical protein [Burkholderiales bacterium]
MQTPTAYLLLALGGGLVLGLATGMHKTSTALVSMGTAVALWIFLPMRELSLLIFLLEAVFLYGAIGALGAWIGVELRSLTKVRLLPASGPDASRAARSTARFAAVTEADEKDFREAIRCPHCGVASIDWWDKLMSGLIGRHCICDHCGKSSREERKTRFITSAAFLGTLWLIGLIPYPVYAATGMVVWALLLVVFEWHYIHAIPLVPVIDSARWKKIKDACAWGFIALIVATFVFTAIFNSL